MSTENNLPDPQEIIDTLSEIREEYWLKRPKRPPHYPCFIPLKGEALKKFKKCATDLSSLLPKVSNSSLFEVDHLWYGDKNNIDVSGTKMCSEETMTYLIENCFESYHNLYVYAVCEYGGTVVDMAYLQLIEHSSTKLFRIVYLMVNARRWNTLHVVRALRILSVASDKHLELVKEQIEIKIINITALFLWMRNLSIIPKSNLNSKLDVMMAWLSRLAEAVLKKLDLSKMEFLNIKPGPSETNRTIMLEYIRKYYPLRKEHCNPEFIYHILRINYDAWTLMPFHYENLAFYFLTAETEDEKIERIKNFFEGLKLYKKRKGKKPMRMDLYYCLRNMAYSFSFRNKTSQLMDQYFTISDDTPVSEPSFTLDKMFYFRDFVREIKVVDAMHTAYLIYDEIFEIKKVDSTFITNEFRPVSSYLKKRLSDFLRNPSMRGRNLWLLQYLLKKCPFLFLSYDHESHMENLIKMLKGIKISKADEESLYFAVNNNSYMKTRYLDYRTYAVFQRINVIDEQDSDEDSDADDQPTSN